MKPGRFDLRTPSVLIALALPALIPAAAAAQLNSGQRVVHEQCFAIKDSMKIKGTVDLFSPQFDLDEGCRLGQARHFCVPAHKEVIEVQDRKNRDATIEDPIMTGPDLEAWDKICYDLHCDHDRRKIEVADQFGERDVSVRGTSMLCVPAVKTCEDPTLSTFAGGGPGVGERLNGSCRQFNGNQTACENAWSASGDGYPHSCFYENGNCRGCGSLRITEGNCTNTCVSCADESRTLLGLGDPGDACGDFDGNQADCENAWHIGRFGPASCYYDAGLCRGCGPANELDGECTNVCRD